MAKVSPRTAKAQAWAPVWVVEQRRKRKGAHWQVAHVDKRRDVAEFYAEGWAKNPGYAPWYEYRVVPYGRACAAQVKKGPR